MGRSERLFAANGDISYEPILGVYQSTVLVFVDDVGRQSLQSKA
jgi:hypothetical protein